MVFNLTNDMALIDFNSRYVDQSTSIVVLLFYPYIPFAVIDEPYKDQYYPIFILFTCFNSIHLFQ